MYKSIVTSFFLLIFAVLSLLPPSDVLASRQLVLTIYHNGGLFLEKRNFNLKKGSGTITIRDINPGIIPGSIYIHTPGAMVESFSCIKKPLTMEGLLRAYRGQEVLIHRHDKGCCHGEHGQREVTLLSFSGNVAIVESDDGVFQVDVSDIVFPSLPTGLGGTPQIRARLYSKNGGSNPLEVVYLAKGFGWKGEYTGVLSQDEKHMDVTAFANLSNGTDAAVSSSRLRLVAGRVNFGANTVYPKTRMVAEKAMPLASPEEPKRQRIFEYHIYDVNRPVKLLPKQRLHITLFQAEALPCKKILVLREDHYPYFRSMNRSLRRLHPDIVLEVETKGKKADQPFPAGNFRVYKKDTRGIPVFMGMDRISGIPQGEKITLNLGKAFDVTAKKKQTFFKRLKMNNNRYSYESSYEIKVHNSKDVPTTVKILERVPGSWSIISENLPHKKEDATHCSWQLTIPPGATKTLTYTIKVID
ncbi:MAG: DUF4139 domain-containing protein [Thermodesulfobacteria bacterium]|nr:DUF4139 domain-containing protein [Thermodesulfobacteriota bacterium]